MKRTNWFSAIIAWVAITGSTHAQWVNKGFTFQGNARQYRVYKSPNYNAANPASMVITLHGLGDNMTNFSGIGMNYVADTANIIVVVPQAMSDPIAGTAWNSGAGASGYYPNSGINDVAFISALIDSVKAGYSINANRVYACGFSMGGFMTERLAIELNQKITSFASVSGTFGFGLPSYNPNKKISIAHFHGTADSTVPYAGNSSGIGADSLVHFWVNNDQCNSVPQHTNLPDIQNDGYTVERFIYSGGQNNTEVDFFKVNGAGHVWLTANNDISYTVEIWKFFNKHQVLATGIEELKPGNDIAFYPNPTADSFTIKLNENMAMTPYICSVFDVNGKEVYKTQEQVKEREYTLSARSLGIKPGIYLIRVQSDQKTITRRFVVQ